VARQLSAEGGAGAAEGEGRQLRFWAGVTQAAQVSPAAAAAVAGQPAQSLSA